MGEGDQAASDRATDGKAHGAATDRLRETAKWIVGGTFAALVVMLGGTSLSSIGLLFGAEPDWARIVVGVLAGVIGFAFLIRLTLDALEVLTFEQFSLPQYGFGVVGKEDEPAEVRFPKGFGTERDKTAINTIRERVERQTRPYWPGGIETLGHLARLELMADKHREELTLEGEEITFRASPGSAGAIRATQAGVPVALPGEGPYHVARDASGKLVVTGRKSLFAYNMLASGKPVVAPSGLYTVTRADIEWFAAAAYNAALFNRVSINFECLQRRLPFNVSMIALGFVGMIAAINPPEPPQAAERPPVVTETSEMRCDAAGNQLRRETTTRSLPAEDGNSAAARTGEAVPAQ